jgi:hypothetical protein
MDAGEKVPGMNRVTALRIHKAEPIERNILLGDLP